MADKISKVVAEARQEAISRLADLAETRGLEYSIAFSAYCSALIMAFADKQESSGHGEWAADIRAVFEAIDDEIRSSGKIKVPTGDA